MPNLQRSDGREVREAFYGNLIWIVDGRSFQNSFHLGWMLPDPSADGFEDGVWFQQPQDATRRTLDSADMVTPFWRISEERKHYPDLTRENIGSVMPSDSFVLVHDGADISDQILASYVGQNHLAPGKRRLKTFLRRTRIDADTSEATHDIRRTTPGRRRSQGPS